MKIPGLNNESEINSEAKFRGRFLVIPGRSTNDRSGCRTHVTHWFLSNLEMVFYKASAVNRLRPKLLSKYLIFVGMRSHLAIAFVECS